MRFCTLYPIVTRYEFENITKNSPENLLENTETLVDVVFEQVYENEQKFGIGIMSDN